jgi:hypothetical protein
MSLAAQLEQARRALIDLSTRNRLLSLPAQGRSRGVIRIADEDANFVVAQLAAGKGFGFEAGVAGEAKTRKRAEGVATASATATRENGGVTRSCASPSPPRNSPAACAM